MRTRRRSPDSKRIEQLEREVLDGQPQPAAKPPPGAPAKPPVEARLGAVAALSVSIGAGWAILMTSLGKAAHKPDNVFDHGTAGYIAAGLMIWPFAVLAALFVAVFVIALVGIALGRLDWNLNEIPKREEH